MSQVQAVRQKSARFVRPPLWFFITVALLLGVIAGAGGASWKNSREAKYTKEAVVAMRVAMQIRALQGNINTDTKAINYELLVLGLTSADIGQRPDTLRPFGIITKDMRVESGTAVANGPSWTRRFTR